MKKETQTTKSIKNINEKHEHLTDDAARKLALSVGQGMLATLAEELPSICKEPWDENGCLTWDGQEAAKKATRSWLADVMLVPTKLTREMAEKCLDLCRDEDLESEGMFYGPRFRREAFLAAISLLEEIGHEIEAVRARGGSIQEELGITPRQMKRIGKELQRILEWPLPSEVSRGQDIAQAPSVTGS